MSGTMGITFMNSKSKVKYSIMYIIHMNGVPISLSLATGPDSHHCNLAVGGSPESESGEFHSW